MKLLRPTPWHGVVLGVLLIFISELEHILQGLKSLLALFS